jgi:arylsulfatase A-like enzyme
VRALLALLAWVGTACATERPNFIFILADDLGVGDLGAYGQTKIKTPHLDRLAAEGLRFTSFYAGHSVCAPSRCTLLTGRHTGHAAIRDNAQRAPQGEGQTPMPAGTITIAQLLQNAGYATACIGKWGLGMPEDRSSPSDFGFHHYYGYLCQATAHTFYPPYLWQNGEKEPLPGNPPDAPRLGDVIAPGGAIYAPDRLTDDALRWVREQKDTPFFLYLAMLQPHLSLQVPEDSLAEYRGRWPETPVRGSKHYADQEHPRAAYAAMVTRMDRDIGRLLALLDELHIAEKTCVFFASDNGAVFPLAGTDPDFFRSNAGLRGHKQDLYEGGIRTPFLARWPGKIRAGGTSDHVGAFWDVLPTLCELAGLAPPAGLDGLSFTPTLLGTGAQAQHDHLYWEYHGAGGRQAVRFGEWKAVRYNVKKDGPLELYHLATDPVEQHDVAAAHPEIAARAAGLFQTARTPSPVAKWNF